MTKNRLLSDSWEACWSKGVVTYTSNGNCGQGEWITYHIGHVDAFAATAVRSRVFHFAQRRGMERTVRWHKGRLECLAGRWSRIRIMY